ncbi:MAG: hypothetical protein U0517_01875 [Candidatus Andersenbacteria bacterium]
MNKADKLFFEHLNAMEMVVTGEVKALHDERGPLIEPRVQHLKDQLEHIHELRAMRENKDYKQT